MKWFLYGEAQTYGAVISNLGLFSEKALVRMQDLKLLAEITHALKHGISTTSQTSLKNLYRDNDIAFPEEEGFKLALKHAFEELAKLDFIRGTNLAKPYMIYSLVLALVYQVRDVPNVDLAKPPMEIDYEDFERRLLTLAAAVDLDEEQAKDSPYKSFITASAERTNVKAQRATRMEWFVKALRKED